MRFLSLVAVAALFAGVGPARAESGVAGNKKSALEKLEEGDAVRKRVLLREGRFEAAPTLGVTLGDAFQRNVLFGAQLAYHFSEAWALGATVFGGVAVNTGLADKVKDERPDRVDDNAFSKLGLLGTLDVYYSPLIGKFALFGREVVHYDLHLLAGIGGAQVSGNSKVEGFSPAPVVGLGMRTFVNDWMSVNLSVRDYIYSSALNAVTQTDDKGSTKTKASSELSNNFALTVGFAFYFPQVPGIGN
jgi:outer membrane beta-barrel protein